MIRLIRSDFSMNVNLDDIDLPRFFAHIAESEGGVLACDPMDLGPTTLTPGGTHRSFVVAVEIAPARSAHPCSGR